MLYCSVLTSPSIASSGHIVAEPVECNKVRIANSFCQLLPEVLQGNVFIFTKG